MLHDDGILKYKVNAFSPFMGTTNSITIWNLSDLLIFCCLKLPAQ